MNHPLTFGRAVPSSPATFDRLLMVLQAIALGGPISFADLSASVPISRGAIWRATHALRRHGWVRMRHSDNALEISHQLDNFFAQAHVAWPECGQFEPLLQTVSQSRFFHASIGMFVNSGEFITADSTNKNALIGKPLSLVYEDFSIAAQVRLSARERDRHIKAFLSVCDASERAIVESGEHKRRLERLASSSVVWGNDNHSFALPISFDTGSEGAILIFAREPNRKCAEKIRLLYDCLNADSDLSLSEIQLRLEDAVETETLGSCACQ